MSPSETPSFDREYRALRTGRAVVELAGWSSISVTGTDRQAFLHNFCTNDVKRLVPGTSCEAFFTNVKGRIVGHGLIHCRHSEFLFIGAPGQGQQLVEHLDRYVIREDVQLRDTTSDRSYLLIAGDTQLEASHASIAWDILGRDDTNLFEFGPHDVSSALQTSIEGGCIAPGPTAFTTARVEAGVPLYGIDFDAQNFPQEVGRDRQAISFTKGCYLGQETVARIDALGHVNQRLTGVRFFSDEIPRVDTEISIRGAKAGQVTSAAFSPQLCAPLALAMVRREANSTGTRLESPIGDCEVIALPLVARTAG